MRSAISVSLCLLMSACTDKLPEPEPVLVNSVAEAGETHISVLSVEPWDTAKAALNAKFNLSTGMALKEAIPRISTFEERVLDIFATNLNVGLPRRSVNATDETDTQGVATSTRTATRSDGVVPDDDVIPAPDSPDVNKLPGLDQAQRTAVLGQNDPLLKYQTARTIHQYVTVLDRVIDNAPQIDNYVPYLVTLQASSFPYSKHQPYDIYLDISFFPKKGHDGANAPIVYPVLITDNLEGQSVSRAAELVRQIGLAANVLSSGFAGTLGLSSYNARAGAVFGTDLTSTFTVGKASENSMTVVLGAARNPISDYAMIRRTHNISVLILVPESILNQSKEHPTVNLLSTVELRRPDQKGAPLQLRTPEEEALENAINLVRERGIDVKLVGKDLIILGDKDLIDLIKIAWNSLIKGGFQEYISEMKDKNYIYPEALYHTVSDTLGKSPNFKTTAIPLPAKPPKPKPFCIGEQTASAFDDPNTREMRVVLTGVKGKTPGDLTATLTLSQNGLRYPLVASKLEKSGGKLEMVFPSAASFGLDKVSEGGGSIRLNSAAETCPDIKAIGTIPTVYAVAPKAVVKQPGTAAKPASAQVNADGKGGLAVILNAAPAKSE